MNNYVTVSRQKNSEKFKENISNESTESTERKNYNSFKQSLYDLFNIVIPSGIIYSIIFCIIFFV